MSSFSGSSFGQPLCKNCGVQPKFPGFDHCGKTCAAEAEKKKRGVSRRTSTLRSGRPASGSTYTPSNSSYAQTLCLTCRTNPSFPGHDYCSKACAVDTKSQRNPAGRTAGAPGPRNSGTGHNSTSYSSSTGGQAFNAPAASNLCEHCHKYVKSEEMDEDGVVVTHSYCGIGCYKASLEKIGVPPSTITARAADPGSQGALNLWVERLNTPIGRKILLTAQERWKSDKTHRPQVKGIYRIDLPGQVYRRFDLALQMNDAFEVTTAYYGGIATCGIADDPDPEPCASESCELCDVLRNSFSNLLYGASSRDGSYGPGLYTYSNPALAHDAMDSDVARDFDDDTDSEDDPATYALIQCRIVTRAGSAPNLNSYAGFIDDSGVVFCAQPTAVIPTHLLTYRLRNSPNSRQSQAASGGVRSSGGFLQTKSVTTGPTSQDGRGKARANLSLQKPQLQSSAKGSPMNSPSLKQADRDLATSAMPPSDPATTALRALVNPNSRGSPLGTPMSPSRARLNDDDALAPPSYGPSRAGSQKATRQSPHPLTDDADDRLGSDRGESRRSHAAAARKHSKRSEDLDSRLDEDEDGFGYLNPEDNSGRRDEKSRFDDEDDEDDDELPDHPPGY